MSSKTAAPLGDESIRSIKGSLFDLPIELRDEIYEYALLQQRPNNWVIEPFKLPPLLFASKQVRAKVLAVMAAKSEAVILTALVNDYDDNLVLWPITDVKKHYNVPVPRKTMLQEELKFRKVRVLVQSAALSRFRSSIVVDVKLDFRPHHAGAYAVSCEHFRSSYGRRINRSFATMFRKAVEPIASRPGFQGFAVKDIPALLYNEALPQIKHFRWEDDIYDIYNEHDWDDELSGEDEEGEISDECVEEGDDGGDHGEGEEDWKDEVGDEGGEDGGDVEDAQEAESAGKPHGE